MQSLRICTLLSTLVLCGDAFALPELPEPIANPAVVAHAGTIYVLGGNDASGGSRHAWKLTNAGARWEALPDMPQARFAHAAYAWGDRIFVVGGLEHGSSGDKALSSVDSFGIRSRTWRREPPIPTPRARFALVLSRGKVYLIGGANDETAALKGIDVQDLVAARWSRGPDLPQPANRLAAVATADDNAIFVIGGMDQAGHTVGTVYRLKTSDGSFARVASLASPRKNFAALLVGGRVMVIGGWDERRGLKTFLASSELYDPVARTWRPGPSLKTGRDGTRALLLHGKVIVIGGYGGSLLKSVEELEPGTVSP